ncbi:type II toxin-antitoxin system VapC family toxin [Agromyces sp. Soil535]|uniref:type II toxin-antitoxin system VapC family toxin n=1 Tax=Agromyces sp. Soil535 TaxID=1736390 RepID=UPI0006F4D6A3|nr:type II toxin-antitoxin system VapC family toxin [Agromyces sp. Soil535]KRE30384.1 twitching motility protein PilT [Agromyces sp. Soil535]
MAHYLDTSALVKLVVAEAESSALRQWLLAPGREPVTSDLARTELLRAVRRTAPDRAVVAHEVLEAMVVLTLSTETFEAAARLDPPVLRALDALHLAVALELGDDLDGIVVYDERLADAANAYGIRTIAPA